MKEVAGPLRRMAGSKAASDAAAFLVELARKWGALFAATGCPGAFATDPGEARRRRSCWQCRSPWCRRPPREKIEPAGAPLPRRSYLHRTAHKLPCPSRPASSSPADRHGWGGAAGDEQTSVLDTHGHVNQQYRG